MIVLSFSAFVIIINLAKGPTINVENSNGDVITNSRICFNSTTYYYLDSDNLIYYITDANKRDVFFEKEKFKFITCNAKYIYAADNESIFQFNFDGKLLKSISRNENDYIFALIEGIFATDDCVFCKIGSTYLLLDPTTLDTMCINDLMGRNEWKTVGDVKVIEKNGIRIISTSPVDINNKTFSGSIVVDDIQIVNLCYGNTVGDTGFACIEYNAYNGTVFKNIYNGKKYNTSKTDIRHFFLTEDSLITFNSFYNEKSVFKKLCILSDDYSVKDYGLYNNYPLRFHEYDQINIINLKTDETKTIITNKNEKIIFINKNKVVTYYDGSYLFYNLDNWERYKKIDANEINSNGEYSFQSCGNYIFVFDSSKKLLDRISISDEVK